MTRVSRREEDFNLLVGTSRCDVRSAKRADPTSADFAAAFLPCGECAPEFRGVNALFELRSSGRLGWRTLLEGVMIERNGAGSRACWRPAKKVKPLDRKSVV